MHGWRGPVLIGLGVGAVPVILGLVSGRGLSWVPIGLLIAVVIAFRAGSGMWFAEPSAWRPKDFEQEMSEVQSIDLDDELDDLLYSAAAAAERRIQDGLVAPFVMYENADGDVKVREVRETDPEHWLQRARETARAIEDARRLVSAVPAVASRDGGRSMRVIFYEAAEEGFRERTLGFVQGYRPKAFLRPGAVTTRLQYIGDGQHTLRFRIGAAEAQASG